MNRVASTVYRTAAAPNQTPPASYRYSTPSNHSAPSSTPSQTYQSRPPTVVGDARHSEVYKMFAAVDTDQSGSITVQELQRALVNGNWTNFDLDTCKMLMNMFDADRNGTIALNVLNEYADGVYTEFVGLWKYISDWQNIFRQFDHDGSGSIDDVELASAFRSFGYNLSPTILMLLEQKYCENFVTPDRSPLSILAASLPSDMGFGYCTTGITFDRFIRVCVTVKTLTENFQREDTDRDGIIQINYETFMKLMLTTP